MKIDKNLNLVVPVDSETEDEVTKIYFHSTPILRETFERYHFVMCATFTRLLEAGLEMTGAKIAALTLQEIAESMGKWEDVPEKKYIGVKNGLMGEIERLTNVVCFTPDGWQTLPVSTALNRTLIDEGDWKEAQQRIVFFTLVCAMTRTAVKNDLLRIENDTWGTQITSSTCTEFAASLPMLSETETSQEIRSSIPI